MQLSKIILGLVTLSATSVTAIDSYCRLARNCDGNGIVCRGINPNVCCQCSGAEIFGSIEFLGVPINWNVIGRGHGGGNCRTVKQAASNGGRSNICLNLVPNYSGAGYGFVNRKRDEESVSSCAGGEEQEGDVACTSFVQPNEFELVDGTKYDLAALRADENKYGRFLSFLTANITAADIPAEFDDIKILE